MKVFLTSLLMSCTYILSTCTTSSIDTQNSTTSSINKSEYTNRMILTISAVRNTDQGQILFMEDDNGQEYTTITESAKGELISVRAGDKVSLIALEFIKTPRANMIIPSQNSIKVID